MSRKCLCYAGIFASVLLFLACGTTESAAKDAVALPREALVFSAPERISAEDLPDGFAGLGFKAAKAADSASVVTTKRELKSALRKGGVIYVSGMIDLSEGMLPEVGGGSTAALDEFVKEKSSGKYSTYKAFMDAYVAACTGGTDDTSSGSKKSPMYGVQHDLYYAYRDKIYVRIPSNTVLIGIDGASGFMGGSIMIDGVSNVVLRNLVIQDGYDPFPHHEANDGYNAEYDAVAVDNAKNVWIDHCTFADTKTVTHVRTGGSLDEKWQTYDGLCDITNASANITISYCKFMNHDKTMLIGSSDSESISNKSRTVTLHHNYFYNCGQRLPMVRLTTVHAYNNYFDVDKSAPYKSQYALGVRYNALIQSEANYYGSGTGYSMSGHASKQGSVYSVGDIDKSANGRKSGQFVFSKTALFELPYSYAAIPAEDVPEFVKAQAGSGVLPVER